MDHNVHGTHTLNRYNFLFVPAIYRFGGQRIHLGPIELGPKAANISWNPWKYADHARTICDIVSFVKVRSMCPGFRFQNSWNSSCERVSSVQLQVASVPISGLPRFDSGMPAENTIWGIPMLAWPGFQGMCPLRTLFFSYFFPSKFWWGIVVPRSSCRFAEKMLHK